MADIKCISITGWKEVSKFHSTNSIRQNKCAWLTVSIWENSSKQFKDPESKKIKRKNELQEKEWKRTYFILKKPILSRVLENQLFLGICRVNASKPISKFKKKKVTYKHLACISLTLWADLIHEISTELLKNTSTF